MPSNSETYDALVAAFEGLKSWRRRGIRGLSNAQIAEIEAGLGTGIPTSYRAFLSVMGGSSGERVPFVGTDMYYPEVLELPAWLAELEHEMGRRVLSNDDVVIAMHQGYIVYFLSGPGDDPPVKGFSESEPGPRVVADSLLDFVSSHIEAEAQR